MIKSKVSKDTHGEKQDQEQGEWLFWQLDFAM